MMKHALLSAFLLLAACGETPVEEQDEQGQLAAEKAIAAEAQTLEQAADESVKTLAAELSAEQPDQSPSTPDEVPPAK